MTWVTGSRVTAHATVEVVDARRPEAFRPGPAHQQLFHRPPGQAGLAVGGVAEGVVVRIAAGESRSNIAQLPRPSPKCPSRASTQALPRSWISTENRPAPIEAPPSRARKKQRPPPSAAVAGSRRSC